MCRRGGRRPAVTVPAMDVPAAARHRIDNDHTRIAITPSRVRLTPGSDDEQPHAHRVLVPVGHGDPLRSGWRNRVVGVTFECDIPPEARDKRVVSTSALPEGLTPGEIDAVVKDRMAAGEDLYRLDREPSPSSSRPWWSPRTVRGVRGGHQ